MALKYIVINKLFFFWIAIRAWMSYLLVKICWKWVSTNLRQFSFHSILKSKFQVYFQFWLIIDKKIKFGDIMNKNDNTKVHHHWVQHPLIFDHSWYDMRIRNTDHKSKLHLLLWFVHTYSTKSQALIPFILAVHI